MLFCACDVTSVWRVLRCSWSEFALRIPSLVYIHWSDSLKVRHVLILRSCVVCYRRISEGCVSTNWASDELVTVVCPPTESVQESLERRFGRVGGRIPIEPSQAFQSRISVRSPPRQGTDALRGRDINALHYRILRFIRLPLITLPSVSHHSDNMYILQMCSLNSSWLRVFWLFISCLASK